MSSAPSLSPTAASESTHILLSVILSPGGTPQQKEDTLRSLKGHDCPWLEILAYPEWQAESLYPSLSACADDILNLKTCRGNYVMFLSAGDILLPEFFDDVPKLLHNSPQLVVLASYANAEQTWLRPAPKHKSLLISNETWFTPWCKIFRADLLQYSLPLSAPPSVSLRCLALSAISKKTDISPGSAPLLIHPEQEPLFPPGREGLRTYQISLKHMTRMARAFTGSVSPSTGYAIKRELFRFLFHEGLRLLSTCSRPQAIRLMLQMSLQAGKAFLLSGAKATAAGALVAYQQNQQKHSRIQHLQGHELDEKVAAIRQKELINVLFVAISPSIWKVDSVMRAMLAHPRFNPVVLIAPEMQIQSPETRRKQMFQTQCYMEQQGYPNIILSDEYGQGPHARIPDEYDILIYPKPYPTIVPATLDYLRYPDRLWISVFYAFHNTCNPHFYEQPIQRFGWIDCYESESSASLARLFKRGERDNAVATGMPFVDGFLYPGSPHVSPWKPQEGEVRKVIWAPHWTINPDYMHLSHFLEIAEDMSALAERTVGRIQWAFKPHPLLYDTLCQHPDWGEKRTAAYYARWETGENTQLETGDYVALFTHSDAMVHDSSSFSNDYHLSGKPVLFLARDLRAHLAGASPMSREAINAQYIGKGMNDIERFINDTVLGGHDPMLAQRTAFREKHLVPPHGRTAAENLIEYILTGNISPL